MNKSVDERLVPQGEYIDALNVRLGSTENSEIGSVENSKGNELLITPEYPSGTTYGFKTLGSFADTANETIYWFVHADATGLGATNVLDIVLSYNIISKIDKNLIRSVKVFDVYEGDNIPEGKKSIALNVTIQSSEKTLKDEDLDRINQLIISTVEDKTGAKIRS